MRVPQELYDNPANVFVAGFIGSPKMNLFKSVLSKDANGDLRVSFGEQELKIDAQILSSRPSLAAHPMGPITVGLRPEGFHVAPDADPEHSIHVVADVVEALGAETLIHFVAAVESASDADVRDRAQASDEEESILAGAGLTVMCARLVPPIRIADGSPLRLAVDEKKLYFFDADTGEAII